MLTLLVALAVIALSIVYFQSTIGKFQRAINNKIPGPPTLPIVGNAHLVGKTPHEVLRNLMKWWREYDQNRFRLWIGFDVNVVISSPKDIENVLSSTQILKKSNIYHLLHPWLGQGLLTGFGYHWQSHRKIITPSFHFKILVDFLEVMNRNSSKFVEKLQEVSKGGVIFDFQDRVCYYTLDVICDTAMGVSINAMDNNDSDIVKAFQYMCYSIQMRQFNPFKRNEFLFRFMPEYKDFQNALNTLKDFAMDVIRTRRDELQTKTNDTNIKENLDNSLNSRQKKAFLDSLLTSTIDGEPLTLQDIYEQVSTFMFEGHDTTSSGISFAVYLLSRHPDVQQKVLEEQVHIFNGDLSRKSTFSDLQEMKYLEMLIKEAQRLFPSVPAIARCTESPYDLNGTIIPKDATVYLFIFGMGYNEKYFPDPYKVDPERFNPETRVKANQFEYVPFSAGPRNCIGQKFAMMEMKSVISKIVRAFKILPPEDGLYSKDGYEPMEPRNKYDPVLSNVITLKSDNGIHIRLEERRV